MITLSDFSIIKREKKNRKENVEMLKIDFVYRLVGFPEVVQQVEENALPLRAAQK